MVFEKAPNAWGNPGTIRGPWAPRSKGDNIIRFEELRKSKKEAIEEDMRREVTNRMMEFREPKIQREDIRRKRISEERSPGGKSHA